MKTCPQCQQTFRDEYAFCLSDGTPLVSTTEVPTVVKPRESGSGRRTKVLVFILAALLSLSLGITASVLYFFWPRGNASQERVSGNTNANPTNASPTQTPVESPTATRSPSPTKTPKPTPSEENTDAETPGSDPGPTRISFQRGSSQASVAGALVRQRSYLLHAAPGQELTARLSSRGGCASFENGSRLIRFRTEPGDNVLTIRNDCDEAVRFNLRVVIR